MHGFCRECGVLGRKDNLVAHHFKHCQPGKPAWESGFLLNGYLPATNQSEFKMTLALIQSGATDSKCDEEHLEDIREEDTVSDEDLLLEEPHEVITKGENLSVDDKSTKSKSSVKRGRKPNKVSRKTSVKKREQKAEVKHCSDYKMTVIQTQDQVTNFFTQAQTETPRPNLPSEEPSRKVQRLARSTPEDPILMTCLRAEGKYGCKTVPIQKECNLPM